MFNFSVGNIVGYYSFLIETLRESNACGGYIFAVSRTVFSILSTEMVMMYSTHYYIVLHTYYKRMNWSIYLRSTFSPPPPPPPPRHFSFFFDQVPRINDKNPKQIAVNAIPKPISAVCIIKRYGIVWFREKSLRFRTRTCRYCRIRPFFYSAHKTMPFRVLDIIIIHVVKSNFVSEHLTKSDHTTA